MIAELLAQYEWAVTDYHSGSLFPMVISLIQGSDEAVVVEFFHGDPAEARMVSYSDAWDLDTGGRILQTMRHGDWLVAIEPLGATGAGGPADIVLSRNGRFFSTYRHPNGPCRITESVRGERVTQFDPAELIYRFEYPTFNAPDWPELAELTDLCDEARQRGRTFWMLPACLAIMELHTGVRMQPAWLRAPLRTFTLGTTPRALVVASG